VILSYRRTIIAPNLFKWQRMVETPFWKANLSYRFVIVGGGNVVGYVARTFVENGMADGKLCIVSKESVAPYKRPSLTKAYMFPLDKKPARLSGFHTCVGSGGKRQTPEWYKDKGIE